LGRQGKSESPRFHAGDFSGKRKRKEGKRREPTSPLLCRRRSNQSSGNLSLSGRGKKKKKREGISDFLLHAGQRRNQSRGSSCLARERRRKKDCKCRDSGREGKEKKKTEEEKRYRLNSSPKGKKGGKEEVEASRAAQHFGKRKAWRIRLVAFLCSATVGEEKREPAPRPPSALQRGKVGDHCVCLPAGGRKTTSVQFAAATSAAVGPRQERKSKCRCEGEKDRSAALGLLLSHMEKKEKKGEVRWLRTLASPSGKSRKK